MLNNRQARTISKVQIKSLTKQNEKVKRTVTRDKIGNFIQGMNYRSFEDESLILGCDDLACSRRRIYAVICNVVA